MGQDLHLLIMGSSQGQIKGDSTIASMGREDTIEAHKFEHMVYIPRAVLSSGNVAGSRVHDPITITKRIDRSTPCLYQALCNNESLDVTIRFYRPGLGGAGVEEQFFTIRLRDARIVSIKSLQDLTMLETSLPFMEDVSIAYKEITWNFSAHVNTMFTDEWNSS